MARFLQFDNVAFSYPGMAEPLLGGVTAHFPEGAWTGIVGANGAGKTTLLKLAAGVLLAALKSFRGVGLLVSHDERFLARLTVRRWQLMQSGDTVRLTMVSSIPDRT